MPRICVVTGSRSEYGLLRPILRALQNSPCELRLIVSGMHLLHEFGHTDQQIEDDGFHIDARVDMTFGGDSHAAMAKGIGIGIYGTAQALESLNSEIVLVLGDRTEAFAAAIAGAALNRVVAHTHGGEVTRGGLDESMRHAITKLAHIHFVATACSRERVLRLGERPQHVLVTGAPGLDSVLGHDLYSREELSRRLDVQLGHPLVLLVQHAVSTAADQSAEEMSETLSALANLGYQTIAIYPNCDAGGRRVLERLRAEGKAEWLRVFPNLDHKTYLSLLAASDVLVGNSSSGIIEAPAFHVPVVNVGPRQHGRERSPAVLDVPGDGTAIKAAISRALNDEAFREQVRQSGSVYGDGHASQRIVEYLVRVKPSPDLLQKQITY